MTNDNLPPLPYPAVAMGCDPGNGGQLFHLRAFSEKQMHEYGQACRDAAILAPIWIPIDSAPLSDPLVVWQGGDWVLAECSEYRGWCDLQGFELDPQPTHYMPIPPLPEPNP